MRREQTGERKHRIAEADLATDEVEVGVFLVQVAKAPGDGVEGETVGQDRRNREIGRRREYVNHYPFHIIDPQWGT